ncbi:MAG: extracellular solute-binding protein [Clostridia bacterium]|nr:extracellular solute-binding protein [Clostridia bacterium]
MKKRLIAVSSLTLACMLAFGACGGKTSGGGGGGGGSSSSEKKEGLQVELLDLGADFNSEYYPVTEKLEERQGSIEVSILFDGTLPGWQAVANEYQRLHRDQVVVNLDNTQVASDYGNTLNYELSGGNTDWDIVQGNLAATGYMQRYCLNMYPSIQQKNYYAGDKYWSQVLEEDAYQSDKTGASTQTYLMNSEGLQTAWFINTVALQAAGAKGYKNGDGEVGMPKTWDEMMDLCAKMQDAGYKSPLGISLATDSISASQFTWLLRVYGDYYYRNEYDNVMKTEGYEVDLSSPNPESNKDYSVSYSKLFNIVLGENISGGYVGATSNKFLDFVSQLGKMAPYLRSDVAGTALTTMREDFQYQKKDKESPQIMLDYVGAGLGFLDSQNDKFQMDFFDYPIMVNDYVDEEKTLLRDVGGNGGYLSVVNHDNDQNALTLDFIKFFMSPYGQTIYYQGLSAANAAPKGLTLVNTDYVLVPQAWKDFFATDKISFTGLSDSNPFVGQFIRGLDSRQNSSAALQTLWSTYLTTGMDLDEFGGTFQDSLMADWPDFCASKSWNAECYIEPDKYDY